MKTSLLILALLGGVVVVDTALADPVSGQGTWESTLQARDIGGDNTVDAYYDTVLDITWLVDSKAAQGSIYDDGLFANDGYVTWASAMAWVASLNVYGTSGWRLPTAHNRDGSGLCFGNYCPESEMGHLYNVTLGNADRLLNTGPFLNQFGGGHWTSTDGELDSPPGVLPRTASTAWRFSFSEGRQSRATKVGALGAWAVRDGDILAASVPVPEPGTLALVVAAMLGAAATRRRGPAAPTA